MTTAVPVGVAVAIVKPRGRHEEGPAEIVDVQPSRLPLEGGGSIPSQLYALRWPDGGTTWHLRHQFEPVPESTDEGPS